MTPLLHQLIANTNDVERRWDLNGVDRLNECMKLHYLALYDTVKDFENELAKDQLSYRIHYVKEAVNSSYLVTY